LALHILGIGISAKRLGSFYGGSTTLVKHQVTNDCQFLSKLDYMVDQFSSHFKSGVAHSSEWSFRASRRGILMAWTGSGPPDAHFFRAFRHWPDGGSFFR
jgi:hypothetical protein